MEFNTLECIRLITPGSNGIRERIVSDYEIDFCMGGQRTVCIDGREYITVKNDVCIKRPGQKVLCNGDNDCFLLTLNFDTAKSKENYLIGTLSQTDAMLYEKLICDLPQHFAPIHIKELKKLFEMLVHKSDCSLEKTKMIVQEILMLLNADSLHCALENEGKESAADIAIQYIKSNFKKNITLEEIASQVGLDKSYFLRMFKKKVGITPGEYLISCRLSYAQALLTNTDMSVNQICDECGYNNVSFFITSFKSHFGVTPKNYRENDNDNQPIKKEDTFEKSVWLL